MARLLEECRADGLVVGEERMTDGLEEIVPGPEEEEGPDESKSISSKRR